MEDDANEVDEVAELAVWRFTKRPSVTVVATVEVQLQQAMLIQLLKIGGCWKGDATYIEVGVTVVVLEQLVAARGTWTSTLWSPGLALPSTAETRAKWSKTNFIVLDDLLTWACYFGERDESRGSSPFIATYLLGQQAEVFPHESGYPSQRLSLSDASHEARYRVSMLGHTHYLRIVLDRNKASGPRSMRGRLPSSRDTNAKIQPAKRASRRPSS